MSVATTNLHSRVLKSSWSDGLLDVFAGVGVLLIGVSWQLDLAPLGSIAPALLIPVWQPLRAKLIEPRRGYMELGERAGLRLSRALWLMIIMGTGTLALGVAVYFYAAGGVPLAGVTLIAGLPSALIGVAALVAGAVFGLTRFPFYAGVFLVCGALTILLGLEPGVGMIVGGAVAAASGLVVLTRFLRTHPVIDGSEQ